MKISREDAESNARLIDALYQGIADTETLEKQTEVASHLQLDLDEEGKPKMLRFAYVDELECIGCTYCASIARNTFFMEEEAGRARVYAQGDDDPELVMEAIDCCPVNCISFVDHSDLVILETERDGINIDQRSIGTSHGDRFMKSRQSETKAKLGGGLMCCNNCPSRGCRDCPMYGVGLNPVYIARLEERQARREQSGELQAERTEQERAGKVASIFETSMEGAPDMAADATELAASLAEECIVESQGPAELVDCVGDEVLPSTEPTAPEPAPESLSDDEARERKLQALFAAPDFDDVDLDLDDEAQM